MYEENKVNKNENIKEVKLLSEIRKLAVEFEDLRDLPHEPELVHARAYCNQLLIVE